MSYDLDERVVTGEGRYNHRTGKALKEKGQQLVLNIDPQWKSAAAIWVYDLGVDEVFSADELVRAVGLPRKRNQVGALMSHLAKRGLVTRVGFRPSHRDVRRAGMVAVWKRIRTE